MAKVSTIKFNLNGNDYQVHVNCDSSGTFKANLPEEVAKKLNLEKTLRTMTLDLLEKDFKAAIKRYKEAETKQELLIAIRYGSNGRFCEKENGDLLFGGHNHPFLISLSWSNANYSVLLFEFKVIVKETIDTVVNYYNTRLGKNFPQWSNGENKHKIERPDDYFKDNDTFRYKEEWKLIPFTKQSLESLQNAQNKIRAVSELLYTFVSQDEKLIEETLTKTKLLN